MVKMPIGGKSNENLRNKWKGHHEDRLTCKKII